MERRIAANGVVYHSSPLLEQRGVKHGFSTRIGGVSDGIFQSLNLGNPSGVREQDPPDRIEENYARLQAAIGCAGMERCLVHQIHGSTAAHLEAGEPFEAGQKADAIISNDANRLAAVRVADCVPILLASDDGRIVAAVHAGWRGIVGGVVPRAIEQMRRRARPGEANLTAALGPCIGVDAFEVGAEVILEFERAFGANAPVRKDSGGKGHVDLNEAIRRQLVGCGIADERIDVSDRCTFRDAEEFFSHRRDHGATGRMAAIIAAALR